MRAKRPVQPTNTLAYAASVGPKPSDENCAACNPMAASVSTSAAEAPRRQNDGERKTEARETAAAARTQIRMATPKAVEGFGWWWGQPRQTPFVFNARRYRK